MQKFRKTLIIAVLGVMPFGTKPCFAKSIHSFESFNHAFAPGEEVVYVLSYTWFFVWTDVGEAYFKVHADTLNQKEVWHLHLYGTSYPFYDWFFKVRDVYESWVEPNSLLPLRFNRAINEGGYTKENEYNFDWKKRQVDVRIRRKQGENRYYTIPVEKGTVDVVTAIYLSRNLDFRHSVPLKSYHINVMLDREVYDVQYTYLGKERKTVKGLGEFNALKFRIELIAGDVFKKGQYLLVWVTDDENRLPIYIETPIRVGSVRARLHSWKGLKSDMKK